MVKTRGRKILGDILARRGRSLMVILSIMIGVFGVATMLSITDLLNRQLKEDIKTEQISHTQIYVISGGESITAAENRAYLENLKTLPGVVDVEGQAVYRVDWQHDNEQKYGVMFAFSEPFEDADLQTISRLIDGRYPKTGEIAVEPRFAEANNLEIGDKLRFPNTGNEEWEIVGIVLHPYYAEFPSNQTSILVDERIFANYEDAHRIVGFTGLSVIQVRYESTAQSREGLNELVDAIGRKTPYLVYYTYQDDPEDNFLMSVMADMTGAMDGLGIVSMIVSGFLVTNVMNTVIVEQRRQIGAMKSLGASFGDNFRIYAGIALVYGVIGTALGLLLAVPAAASAARPVANWAAAYIEGYKISPVGLGVGAVMGLLVPILATLLPLWQASRISILDAVTDLGISSDWGTSRLSRIMGRLPLPLPVLQASNNIIKKKERLALTILTLTAAVAAFMGATAVSGSLNSFGSQMIGIHNYEIRVTPQRASDYEQMVTLVSEKIEDAEAVYPGLDVLVQVPGFSSRTPLREGSNQVTIAGFDPATPTYNFDLLEGTGWSEDPTRRGIIISRPLADSIAKHVGDTLSFIVNDREHSYEIIGIDSYVFEGIFMDWRELAHIAGYVDDAGQPQISAVYITLEGDATVAGVDDEIEKITTLLNANEIHATFFNQPRSAEVLTEQVSVLGIIFQMMSLVMAAVSAIGLLAALSMAVLERQKEIGVMRSVGASSRTVMSQFMLEGIWIGLLAWMAAIPLGILMGQSFLGILPLDYMVLDFPPQLVALGLGGVMIVVTLASLWPSLMASRKTVSEILRYQ